MWETDGFRGERERRQAAGVATAEESSSSTKNQMHLKWLDLKSRGAAFLEQSWTQSWCES